MTALPYLLLALPAFALVSLGSGRAAFTYQIASRLLYVLYVAVVLRREARRGGAFCPDDARRRFRRFLGVGCWAMINDGMALVVLSWVTRGSIPASPGMLAPAGAALAAVGIACKLWACRVLGFGNVFWRDAFHPPSSRTICTKGPYRYLRNPMYTVGYLQAYGVPLMLGSWPGLLAGFFDHMAILLLYAAVEAPHVRLTYAASRDST